MPNHVTNELVFRNVDSSTMERICGKLCLDGKVDFEVLVPLPLNMWWGSVGTRHEKTFKRTALDWCRENWGTKWGAYDQKPVEYADGILTFVFDTAWSPPYPWLAAVFNGLKMSFDHNWLDEGESWGHHGVFDISKMDEFCGDPWIEDRASEELQKHLHLLAWGCESFPPEGEETEGGTHERTP